ncbi:IS21 family transposase [Synechococcus sp. BA-132 BA5]|uniref:IS21 family transposase n=1 Tax=Synechococcus sp. BA-132 BA5 TaxID=3110252 RepID=UPI002B1FBF9D|nr:IS21 family transposase [Synechococcus sp. BA-132 BA5]MEA5416295.1 IS21 family transposase [Synechococcus sp. BA-132 BA5]
MPAPLSLRIKERYMARRSGGLSQQVAADAVGISVRSAQRIDRGELQPEGQQQQPGRRWRTRADPLADVWDTVLVPMLEKAPQLEPQTLLLHLEQIRPGEEWFRRKRTLQRRVEQWRALYGPGQEVMFLQEHRAGVLGISDFTLIKGAPITIAGQVLEHRLFHFRLPYSGWCHVAVIHGGESFVALSEALQNALALCGGVPAEHRTDSLSACFRNRDGSYAGDYTSRYRELCAHLGVIATRNNRGIAHENGAIEGPHRHWKYRLEQQLIQRGSRDFATETDYRQLVAQVSASLNNRAEVEGKLAIERLHLQPLPVERFADYEPLVVRVRSTSTIEVRSVTYSVPSRLIGQQLTVHLRHDRLDLFLRSQFVETLPRLHRQAGQIGPLRRIDFRHMIESLRRKPRALLRAQLQADLLPGENWRQLWRQLLAALPPDEAAKVMVDALHVAARTDDLVDVERYLRRQLRRSELSLTALRDHYGLRPPRGLAALPQLDIPEHTLSSYDELLDLSPQPAGAGSGSAIAVETVETAPVPQPVAGGRAAGHSRWLESSQLPLCAGGAGTPAAASSPSAAAVA